MFLYTKHPSARVTTQLLNLRAQFSQSVGQQDAREAVLGNLRYFRAQMESRIGAPQAPSVLAANAHDASSIRQIKKVAARLRGIEEMQTGDKEKEKNKNILAHAVLKLEGKDEILEYLNAVSLTLEVPSRLPINPFNILCAIFGTNSAINVFLSSALILTGDISIDQFPLLALLNIYVMEPHTFFHHLLTKDRWFERSAADIRTAMSEQTPRDDLWLYQSRNYQLHRDLVKKILSPTVSYEQLISSYDRQIYSDDLGHFSSTIRNAFRNVMSKGYPADQIEEIKNAEKPTWIGIDRYLGFDDKKDDYFLLVSARVAYEEPQFQKQKEESFSFSGLMQPASQSNR